MYELPIVVVKGGDSILDFFDHALMNFTKNRVCFGAVNALQVLEESPANVVITETHVGEMTGLELAEAIRDIDSDRNHYTYIILIGAISAKTVDSPEFHASIDVLTGTKRIDVMTHLAVAGGRISQEMNQLMSSNLSLQQLCNSLRRGQLLDPLTGLGNRSFAEQTLDDTIKQIESRGGAACFIMISIANYDAVQDQFDTTIAGELVVAVSERIQSLVRPLDVVTYYGSGKFALVFLQPSIENCTPECYDRIYQGVKLKTYTTSAGFQPVDIAMSICAGTADTGPPNPGVMMDTANEGLDESIRIDAVSVRHIS